MIEVKDRIPSKPNRILIKPENGEQFYATWERADEPIEEGTPLNKLLFDSIDEGGIENNALSDIEIDAQRVNINATWTTVKFTRPMSGVPRVFVSSLGDYIISVKNITNTNCQIAVKEIQTDSAYAASESEGSVTKNITYVTGFNFRGATIDIVAIYDGGEKV